MSKQKLNSPMYAAAALLWYERGLQVIPLIPGSKLPAVKWDPWIADLSPGKIATYWKQHPDHELGFIVGDDTVVLDADAPESVAALVAIEKAFNITSNMVIQTRRGQHHYFRLAPGTFAKTDSHGTADHPERLDVKAKRSMVVLPPSTGKAVLAITAGPGSQLIEVGQDFIDAVFLHNGRPLPRPSVPTLRTATEPTTGKLRLLQVILSHLDADCGYNDWTAVGMALSNETGGSDDGDTLYDAWSSTGKKYDGRKATAAKWASFRSDCEGGYTIGTLFMMAEAADFSREQILAEAEPFDTGEGEDGAG
jgi:hypothetical protein